MNESYRPDYAPAMLSTSTSNTTVRVFRIVAINGKEVLVDLDDEWL